MDHFVAYHSVQRMGYELEPSEELDFLSRKIGLLNKAIGQTVWVIQGKPNGRKTTYSLSGSYIADRVEPDDSEPDLFVISGHRTRAFHPPIVLNDLDWFPTLLRSQSNFSLGFNRLNEASVIQALTALHSEDNPSPSPAELPDVDLPLEGSEGAVRLVTHLRRERDRSLVEAKKRAVLATRGNLSCEACGFDFAVVYGDIGDSFCEVHHLTPLSASSESTTTTLNDLAVLCSNCHRIIHRSTPMLSVAELSALIRRTADNKSGWA